MPHSRNHIPPRQPRIAAHIALHARRRPGAVAVLRGDGPVTYAHLHRDLCAVTQALRGFNLPSGAVAAIGHEDFYAQLLLICGCEALGIVTGSFRPDEGPDADDLIASADLVLSSLKPAKPARRFFEVTQDWLAQALATPALYIAPPAALPDEGEAICRSSGTTGAPKRMLLTHAMLRARLAAQRDPHFNVGLTAQSRFLVFMHFAVGIIYITASNLLRLGGTLIFLPETTPAQIEQRLAGCRPTHLTIMPFQLRGLVASLPDRTAAQGPLLPGLAVRCMGGSLPNDLRHATLRRLAGQIRETYGTNELGNIGTILDGVITLAPGVTAELVGPDGTPLPPGEPGALRIRTQGMVTGYIGDPDASARMFRDGWFHPGDIAIRTGPAQLRLVGRNQDILNLGGYKMPAAELEAKLLAGAPLQDVALLQRNDGASPPIIIVCAVPKAGTTMDALKSALAALMPFPYRIHPIAAIPRTPQGKIKRPALHDALFPPVETRAAAAE
jgi:acyl-coenzyme A synthetase/AMP-(fatty) acid ligase